MTVHVRKIDTENSAKVLLATMLTSTNCHTAATCHGSAVATLVDGSRRSKLTCNLSRTALPQSLWRPWRPPPPHQPTYRLSCKRAWATCTLAHHLIESFQAPVSVGRSTQPAAIPQPSIASCSPPVCPVCPTPLPFAANASAARGAGGGGGALPLGVLFPMLVSVSNL